jgi:ankyrin repeat protein
MDLSQAIAQLLHREERNRADHSANDNGKLADIINQIAKLASGSKGAQTESKDIFAQLAIAARSGQSEIFQELVKAEQQQPSQEPTLLMAAVMANQREVVQALIAAGADVNAEINQFFEFNALNLAVSDENIAIAQVLLKAGADPNSMNASPGMAPIVSAIKKNNTDLVRLLLQYQASVQFNTGFKILVEAANQNNPELIQLLLDAGCDVNESDYQGSALAQACSYCHVETIKVLLSAGATFSTSGEDLMAIFRSRFLLRQLIGEQADPTLQIPAAIQAFIDAGADLDVRDQWMTTAVSSAISFGHGEVLNMLLTGGASPNLKGKIPNILAIEQQDLRPLLAHYNQPTSPLHLAAVFGQTEMAQMLIAAGAVVNTIDEEGRSPIDIAIKEGHQAIVQLLEQAGATVPAGATQFSADALLGAAKQGNLEVLRSALEAGIDPNTSEPNAGRSQRHKTALMFAAEAGHVEAVELLIEHGADVNRHDRPGKKLGRTPLMCAATSDDADLVRLLLEAGAIVDAQDKRGQTALFYAVEEESAAAVEVLLEFGADPHKQCWDGTAFEQATYADEAIAQLIMAADQKHTSPASSAAREEMLRSAAFDGNASRVRDLIQQGVDVNAADNDGGWTALMFGAAKGHVTIVQLLIAAGANVRHKSTEGQTARTEAKRWGHKEVVALLLDAGALTHR